MVKTHLHVTMLASARRGTKFQVPQETKASTSWSIAAFHSCTCAASTCDRGTNSEATKRAKARMEKDDHRKKSEKWDGEYKRVYPCKG